jgi:biotin carboxylase
MKEVLTAHGLPCARHRLCGSADEALAFAQEVGYPVVAKPPAGAGARTTVRADEEAQLRAFLAAVPPGPDHETLVEEFVRGREFSFDSVTVQGRHEFHSISSYQPTPLEVLGNPWIQWCVVLPRAIDGPEFAPIREVGPKALTALGMTTGMSHMEWFRRADGTLVIGEVAARPPGAQFMTLMSYAHDTDMYRAWAQLMVSGTFRAPSRIYAAGAAYLRGQGEGRIKVTHGLAEVQVRVGALVVESSLPKPGEQPASSYEGDGYVIVRHPRTEVVQQALQTIIQTLRVELG